MNTKQNTESLAARLRAEADEKVRVEQEASARSMAVAEAWDAAGFKGATPWFVSGRKGIYGDAGSLSFRDVGPDVLAELMRAFPAIPRVTYSENRTRYFHPDGARTIPEGVAVTHTDGFEISISGSRGTDYSHDELAANWSAMVGDVQTSFSVELRRVSFLHPRTSRRAVMLMGHTFSRYEGAASLVWPQEFNAADVMRDAGVTAFSYYAGDHSSGDFRLRGRDVLALVSAWEAEANRRGAETRAAFLAAYAGADAMPSRDDVLKRAAEVAADYAARKGGLRAGTLEQAAALDTPQAHASRAVAEKHWPAYAAHHGIDTRQTWFDHYAWACDFLTRCGFYAVPVTPQMRAEAAGGIPDTVETITYGARWF